MLIYLTLINITLIVFKKRKLKTKIKKKGRKK